MKTERKSGKSDKKFVIVATEGAPQPRRRAVRESDNSSALIAKATARADHFKATSASSLQAPIGTLGFDPKEFWHHVETFDLSDQEKTELIESVWRIMVTFVSWNFDVRATELSVDSVENPLDAESAAMIPSQYSMDEKNDERPLAEGAGEVIHDKHD